MGFNKVIKQSNTLCFLRTRRCDKNEENDCLSKNLDQRNEFVRLHLKNAAKFSNHCNIDSAISKGFNP